MIWFMTTVHVRANQTTVDWAEGAEFVCERTPLVDNLIQHGGLTELDAVPDEYTDTSHLGSVDGNEQLDGVKPEFAEGGVVDAQDKVAAAYANANSVSEERQDAEKALGNAQADAAAAQENLDETRADAAETIAELNTELDNEPPKTTRSRRKAT